MFILIELYEFMVSPRNDVNYFFSLIEIDCILNIALILLFYNSIMAKLYVKRL